MNREKSIMVVDDNADLLQIVRTVLEQTGYHVSCAHSGRELFKQLEQELPDLIFLDIMMPDMDGLQVLSRLKNDPKTSFIPIAMLTVKDQHDDILSAYRLGCDYYITKPFAAATLLTGVKLILS